MIITISGTPGSGKTTVAKLLSQRLSLRLVTGGQVFREQAAKLNISLSQLGSLAENDEKFDRSLDNFLLETLKKGENIIVESRLAGWLCHINHITAFKVFINADEDVRINRIRNSLNIRVEEKGENLRLMVKEREESEWKRYKKYYGIDYSDTSIYDLIVDSTDKSAEKVSEVIISAFNIWKGAKGENH
jgi:predicted cytidylate kinase